MKQLHLLILLTATNHVVFRGCHLCVLLSAVSLGASPTLVGVLAALFSAPVAPKKEVSVYKRPVEPWVEPYAKPTRPDVSVASSNPACATA